MSAPTEPTRPMIDYPTAEYLARRVGHDVRLVVRGSLISGRLVSVVEDEELPDVWIASVESIPAGRWTTNVCVEYIDECWTRS